MIAILEKLNPKTPWTEAKTLQTAFDRMEGLREIKSGTTGEFKTAIKKSLLDANLSVPEDHRVADNQVKTDGQSTRITASEPVSGVQGAR